MEFRQLIYFVEVCKSGSFSRAAEKLYVSQQGLSVSIKRLEEDLDTILLYRTRGGVLPTEDGQFLLERVTPALKTISELEDHFHHKQERNLVIACVPDLFSLFSSFFLNIQEESPEQYIEFISAWSASCETMVLDGQADLAITSTFSNYEKLKSTLLLQTPYHVILHPDHPLANCQALTLDQLQNQRIVSLSQRFRAHDKLLVRSHHLGFEPNIYIRTESSYEIFSIILSHPELVGICAGCWQNTCQRLGLRSIPISDPEYIFELFLTHRTDASNQRRIQHTKKTVLDFFSQMASFA